MSNSEYVKMGQVSIDPESHLRLVYSVGDVDIEASLPPHRTAESDDHIVGVEEVTTDDGTRANRYLKIPRFLREAQHSTVEYYDSYEGLRKGVKAVSVVAGMVTVGSLVVMMYKRKPTK